MNLTRRSFLTLAAGLTASAPSVASAALELNGGGSSFIQPVLQRWIALLPASVGAIVNYSVLGTGTAQTRILQGEIDFAAVELPLSNERLETGDLLQFPVGFGALVPVVNLPDIAANRLRLTGPLLGNIFQGRIKDWKDPAIAEVNPRVTLPELGIQVIRLDKPDGSVFSTTTTFKAYLLATNPDWRQKYGDTVPRRWAVGSMAGSTELMVDTIKATPGMIGYAPLGTVIGQGLTPVMLRNNSGAFVAANTDTLRAAVEQIDWKAAPGLVVNPLDLRGENTWPLVLPTYAMFKRRHADPARGAALRQFLKFIVNDGGKGAAEAHAASLPRSVAGTLNALLNSPSG